MERLSTKKSPLNRNLIAEELSNAVDLALQYVDRWAESELIHITVHKKTPVLLPIKKGFFTGYYYIKYENDFWSVYSLGKELIRAFTSKHSAIAWCFTMQLNNIKLADEILNCDERLGRILIEIQHYQNSIEKCNDSIKQEILEMRKKNSVEQAKSIKSRLIKNINRAKYLKIPQWKN
ncbi:MAG: hypothetical protein N2235_01530 [Fischerella sp.]|nr:hypothetical protein [Fischerella sp.]